MKIRSAIKKLCPHCYIVQRGKNRFVYCKETPKHKQRQGYHTMSLAQGQMLTPGSIPSAPVFNNSYCHVIEARKFPLVVAATSTVSVAASTKLLPSTKYVPSMGLYGFIPV
mmetsp:Transcript_24282/g.26555  ORF Transcript_24282/g.26555 Transcript_24282/m.26555 type:complete len:111 (+) Transcript_24282:112-444(+)